MSWIEKGFRGIHDTWKNPAYTSFMNIESQNNAIFEKQNEKVQMKYNYPAYTTVFHVWNNVFILWYPETYSASWQ